MNDIGEVNPEKKSEFLRSSTRKNIERGYYDASSIQAHRYEPDPKLLTKQVLLSCGVMRRKNNNTISPDHILTRNQFIAPRQEELQLELSQFFSTK